MGQNGHRNLCLIGGYPKIWCYTTIVCFLLFGTLFIEEGIKGVECQGYDDYGGDPYADPGAYDHHDPSQKQEMIDDIKEQRRGYPNEHDMKKKKFKLFEKRRLNHEKAKAFCKKREGQLAQAMNVDEMQRIQMLLMKGTTLSTSVWIGADKKEWKKHSSKMLGMRPNLPPGAMMMGGGPTNMCPSMSMSTRSLAPVECYKEFAFICEFPPGKGKAPPTKASPKKPKKAKNDEMRKKRDLLSNASSAAVKEGDTLLRVSHGPLQNVSEVEQYAGLDVMNKTLTDEFNSTRGTTATESVEAGNDTVSDFRSRHPIPFVPHIQTSGKTGEMKNKDGQVLTNRNNSWEDMDGVSEENDKGRLDLDGNDSGLEQIEDYDISKMERNGAVENVSVPEEDSDMKLLNEFDEQLEDMRQITNPGPHVPADEMSKVKGDSGINDQQKMNFTWENVTDANRTSNTKLDRVSNSEVNLTRQAPLTVTEAAKYGWSININLTENVSDEGMAATSMDEAFSTTAETTAKRELAESEGTTLMGTTKLIKSNPGHDQFRMQLVQNTSDPASPQ